MSASKHDTFEQSTTGQNVFVAFMGWIHWLLVIIAYCIWLGRGSPAGGDVLWYYVIGFVPGWIISVISLIVMLWLRIKGLYDLHLVPRKWFILGALGVLLPIPVLLK